MSFYYDNYGWLRHYDFDTPIMPINEEEEKAHIPLWENAKGKVLIIGLGIGFCLPKLLENPLVEEIYIVEKYPEVIELFKKHHSELAKRVHIIQADAWDYEQPWLADTIWVDTFGEPTAILIERYKAYLAPGGWIGRWKHA